jgi:tRNA (cytidine56-2'-O)-methyltransferase
MKSKEVDKMIIVLRLGHRRKRDERLSTHCGLIARAFGADKIIFSGEKDDKLIISLKKVTENWGGTFEVGYEKNWKNLIKTFQGVKIHLTMYGIPIQDKINEIRKITTKDILIIIGSEKVPKEVYTLADYNIAITSQPHSEAAALAVFLHEYFQGKELNKEFENGKFKIIPQEKGKKVMKQK